MTEPACWICGDPATTGEHKIKATDLRMLMPSIKQDAPAYYSEKAKSNLIVRSPNSQILKFRKSLCAFCNGTRSQPYDRAWEMLSRALLDPAFDLRPGKSIFFRKVFAESTSRKMKDVQLFFIKMFGCQVVEQNLPLDLSTFSYALRSRTFHHRVYLSFHALNADDTRLVAGAFEVMPHYDPHSGEINGAGWMYILDRLTIQLIYAEPSYRPSGLVYSWQPRFNKLTAKVLPMEA